MLKFIKGKGQHISAERQKLQKELFAFNKTIPHGFPHRPTALAWDPNLRLLAIGTKQGLLRVYGAPGVEFGGEHTNETAILKIFFVNNQGRLITLCEDSTLYLWELNEKDGKCILEQVKLCTLEGRLKKISTCCMHSSGDTLYIGTEGGNVYILDVKTFTMSEQIIYQDVIMQNVPDDFKVNPGAVEVLAENPISPEKLIIGYNRGLMVLWNTKEVKAENTYIASQQLENASWHRGGSHFISSHNDGSYNMWNSDEPSKPTTAQHVPYGPYPCKPISKIMWNSSKGDEDYVIFAGGMPRASYGDKNTVSVVQGDKQQVLDFTSKVVDFFTISDASDSSDYDNPHTLVVLVEEEIVAFDLDSDGWLPYRLPYLASLHASAITCSQHYSDVSDTIWNKIVGAGKKQYGSTYTHRDWPIDGGSGLAETPTSHNLLLTGHEDGTIRFWDASGVSLHHIYTMSTSHMFIGEEPEEVAEEVEVWPPFRKVGTFDPYSDDPRLSLKKISMCVSSGTLVAAGTAGQVVILNLQEEATEKEVDAVTVGIVSERDNFAWKGHEQLKIKNKPLKFDVGFQPSCILQILPPAAITAIALNSDWGLVAAGTSHGFCLFDYIQKKSVAEKCTLNPSDHAATAAADAPMSRRKSFKKSLRESFRRLRKGRSGRQKRDKTPSGGEEPAKPSSGTEAEPKETVVEVQPPAPAVVESAKPVERAIEARSTEDYMTSMVRCLYLAQSYIVNNMQMTSTLWAGTNSGAIYVFTVHLPATDKRSSDAVTCQLGKEIQLKHRAPVIAIQIIDNHGNPLPDALHEKKAGEQNNGAHRVLICSEEQFKIFTLPSLKPYCKYKLTAHDGSKVRRVGISHFKSKTDNYSEYCMTCLTNLGDISIYTIPDLRRQLAHHFIKKEDINGISSLVFTRDGQGFYLHSPCELKRFSMSAKNIINAAGIIELPPDARPKPPKEEPPTPAPPTGDNNETAPAAGDSPAVVEATEANDKKVETATDEKAPSTENAIEAPAAVEANVTQESDKMDITVDSVKDHLANMTIEENKTTTTVIEKSEETITTKVQEASVTVSENVVNNSEDCNHVEVEA